MAAETAMNKKIEVRRLIERARLEIEPPA